LEIKPDEITSILRSRIEGLDADSADLSEVGTVLSVADGICRIHGLENCMSFEMLELPHDVTGLAMNLESDNVGAVLFGEWDKIVEGDTVKRTKRLLEVPVGDALLGRIVDPLGHPLDGKGEIETSETRPAEHKAPGVVLRQPVKEPMLTGLKAIDSMIPIGRGQRELIIGDRQTGKTAIALDTIINNRDRDLVCVYVAIGQRKSTVVALAQILEENDALENTIIVMAPADESAPIKFLAPYAGCAMAEYFLYDGRAALVVYDDLTKHAYAYRQMSLLLRRPPGREAYPGDVFYLHSRLLERAVKLADELTDPQSGEERPGGGSLTALPIIETQAGDVSAYIPTNVISITDGQIYLQPELFRSGVRPAINVGISVSRVGGNAQINPMRKVAGRLKLDLSQYRELEAFSQFGSELDPETQRTLARGERLVKTLNQGEREPMPIEDQVVQIYAATNGYLDRITVDRVEKFLGELSDSVRGSEPDLLKKIAEGDWSEETQQAVDEAVKQFAEDFGYDLDEEGHPLDEEGEQGRERGEGGKRGEGRERGEGGKRGEGRDGEDSEASEEQEEKAA
jgi:F-type H+-transporting ATPase subunit alpha